jgi:DNA-binding GntR family transcriptional regulator
MFETEGLSRTLAERVAAALAEQICAGELKPGERLIEAKMARSLQVSHGPVRDALRLLQSAGVVTISPYKGATVTELSEQELSELFQVRAALAGLRARWLAQDPHRHESIAALEAPIAQLATLSETPEQHAQFVSVALDISRRLTELLANRWLRSMMESLSLQTTRYARIALGTPEGRRESARRWRELLELIRAGDADRAQVLATRISMATYDAALKSVRARRAQEAELSPAASLQQ